VTTGEALRRNSTRELSVAAGMSLFAMFAFYFSSNATLHDMDYTSRIASALLRGELGLRETPPDWLNEMIPQGGRYYSAFPLGAVLSMVPVALLQKTALIHDFPGRALAAAISRSVRSFLFQFVRPRRRITGSTDLICAVSDFWNLDLV